LTKRVKCVIVAEMNRRRLVNENEIFLILGTKLIEARGVGNLAQKIAVTEQVIDRLTPLLHNLQLEMQAHKTRFEL